MGGFVSDEGSMMRFDLVDLRLFDAVARTGSISKSAEQVHLALASASARISGMEAVLGVSLLDRGRRGVIPTAAGFALLVHARSITDGVERMRGDLRLFSSGFKGEIRKQSNTAALVDIVPKAVGLDWLNPAVHMSLRGNGEAAAPGWPYSAKIEDLRTSGLPHQTSRRGKRSAAEPSCRPSRKFPTTQSGPSFSPLPTTTTRSGA